MKSEGSSSSSYELLAIVEREKNCVENKYGS
jgi:hypothetical protein